MLKKILLSLAVGIFILVVNRLTIKTAQADDERRQGITNATTQASPQTKEVTNVGNKICPVSGEKINEKLKATYEYKGKIYNFCCAFCIDEFEKDPQKYIQKVEEELKREPKQEVK